LHCEEKNKENPARKARSANAKEELEFNVGFITFPEAVKREMVN
jgi:hypothetical protein